jgi:hypothetical protein
MSDSTVTFFRSTGRFVEEKQPQSSFANMGKTSRSWYLQEIKFLQMELYKANDKEEFKNLFIRLCQTKKEFIIEYPR